MLFLCLLLMLVVARAFLHDIQGSILSSWYDDQVVSVQSCSSIQEVWVVSPIKIFLLTK
jgi:hypothetical protein